LGSAFIPLLGVLINYGDNVLNPRYSQWSHFGSFIKRPTIRIHFIKWYFIIVLVVCQFFPCFFQAHALDKVETVSVGNNSGLVFLEGQIVHNQSTVSTALSKLDKFWLECRCYFRARCLRSSPLVEADNQQIAETAGNQSSKDKVERVRFYETDEFHAFCLGFIAGIPAMIIIILYGFLHPTLRVKCAELFPRHL